MAQSLSRERTDSSLALESPSDSAANNAKCVHILSAWHSFPVELHGADDAFAIELVQRVNNQLHDYHLPGTPRPPDPSG